MKKGAQFLLVSILGVSLLCGILHLFSLRFSVGDIYPPGSSLRADGLGTKALHDSLEEFLPVERNERPLAQLDADGRTTVLMLGASQWDFDSLDDDLEIPVHAGARVVVSFLPVTEKQSPAAPVKKSDKPIKKEPAKKEQPKEKPSDTADAGDAEPAGAGLWGAKIGYFDQMPAKAHAEVASLEPEVSWHSLMYFKTVEPGWRVLYSCEKKPVVMERSFGRGSIVLAADSYLFSNEALSKERLPVFLAFITGSASRVIFEETHLGVVEHPGTASLIRRYRLHGVVLALMIVAALFVWRNAFPFIPRHAGSAGQADLVEGRSAAEGFVSLLKRSIPPGQLAGECLSEWKRSAGRRVNPGVLLRVEAAAAAGTVQPLETYKTIVNILNEKNNANRH